MKYLSVFFALVNALVFVSSSNYVTDENIIVFNKCCSRNESLIKVSENETYSGSYECIDSEALVSRYHIDSDPLFVSDSIVLNGSLPDYCEELHVEPLNAADETSLTTTNKCFDRLVAEIVNGTTKNNIPKTVAISCVNSTEHEEVSYDSLKVYHVRKCCPRGKSYDRNLKQCRNSLYDTSNYDWLIENFNFNGDYIYEVDDGVPCKFDEYSIELDERSYTFSIRGASLIAISKIGEKGGRLLPGQWCVERDYLNNEVMAQVCTKNCQNFDAYCVRKCCAPGEHFKPRHCGTFASTCMKDEDQEVVFNISSYTNPLRDGKTNFDMIGVRIGIQCPHLRFVLNHSIPQDEHHMTRDGHLVTYFNPTDTYCLEMFDRRDCPTNDIMISAVLCFQPEKVVKDFRISFVIITLSSVCLALTLLVYCVLPELRNVHGYNLICHISMMLLAFTCLAKVQYSEIEDSILCATLGYCIYFGFVAAFAWLNVMCFDIWWTFGSVRTVKPLRKSSSEKRRFMWYSLYAWSITILLTVSMFLLDRYPVSMYLDANIGNGVCWFGTVQNTGMDVPHYIFFVVPMGLITCTNFILWLLTARHCAQVKSEVHRLQAGSVGDRAKRRFRIDRAKYILTGKLWVVMGAGWISELLSTIVSEPQWLWNIVDLLNELQGIFIFLILVVKPKLYYLIRKRLGLEKPDAQKNTSSGRTSSTFLSRTISSDERAHLRTSLPNTGKRS